MNLQQAYYEQKFENEYLRMKGNAFQDFFVKRLYALSTLGKQGRPQERRFSQI